MAKEIVIPMPAPLKVVVVEMPPSSNVLLPSSGPSPEQGDARAVRARTGARSGARASARASAFGRARSIFV